MSEQENQEKTIELEEGVDYYATIRVVSRKGSNQMVVSTSRGPTEWFDNAPEDAYIEVPGSWQFIEKLVQQFKVEPEERDNVINLFATSTETLN